MMTASELVAMRPGLLVPDRHRTLTPDHAKLLWRPAGPARRRGAFRVHVANRGLGIAMPNTVSITSGQIGAGLLSLAPATGPAAPFVAAAGGVAEVVGAVAQLFSGCGPTCTQATQIVEQVGPYLDQNLQNYLSQPVRTHSMQALALQVFDQIWAQVVHACSNPALGAAGQRCISDRQRGSCAYKTTPGGWAITNGACSYTPPGANGSGTTCWNYFVGYRDPIANDPCVVPDPPGQAISGSVSSALSSIFGGGGTADYSGFLLLGIAAVVVMVVVKAL